jgi:2-hydroxy-3-keto-5-methylthiopentenyl-1-phosphate phosphatase
MEELYIGVFEDRTMKTSKNWTEVKSIPYIKYYFKQVLQGTYTFSNGYVGNLYKYFHINRNGLTIPLTFGDFEIIDIAADKPYSEREIIIKEKNRVELHRVTISARRGMNFIIKELIPMVEALEKVRSVEIYLNLQRIPSLEKRIAILEEKLDQRDQTIESLTKQLEECKGQ